MLQMPQRSITRFFIPMIDVLTLLFCIYLLMPMVSKPSRKAEDDRRMLEERLRKAEADLARHDKQGEEVPAQLREEVERLRREKIEALRNRLAVRILEIDPNEDKLWVSGTKPRKEIASQADAERLIAADREKLAGGQRELYYLILYPRDPTASTRPTREQRERYDQWFEGVATRYDIPGR